MQAVYQKWGMHKGVEKQVHNLYLYLPCSVQLRLTALVKMLWSKCCFDPNLTAKLDEIGVCKFKKVIKKMNHFC